MTSLLPVRRRWAARLSLGCSLLSSSLGGVVVGTTSTVLLGSVFAGGVLASGAFAGSLLTGCGKPPPPTTANVKAGDLPPAGDWSGVFYSPLYGHLHLVKQGNIVSGKWRTTNGDKWGELHGEATGDLLKYKWIEHRIGMIGPGSTTEGHGYFKYYVPPDENANHEIRGEWGLDASEVGNPWVGVRQRNMTPNPDSVQPDETERVNMPDAWDGSSKSKKPKPAAAETQSGEPQSVPASEDPTK